MTLEKAIELIKQDIANEPNFTPLKFSEAKQLGIEAGKRLREIRRWPGVDAHIPLPGETSDYCKFCGIAHTGIECPDRGGEK